MFGLLSGWTSVDAIIRVLLKVIDRLEALAAAEIVLAGNVKSKLGKLSARKTEAEAVIARARKIAAKIRVILEEESNGST